MKSLCSNCRGEFDCGVDDPAFNCWCSAKPPLARVEQNKQCYCGACFEIIAKKQGTLASFRLHLAYLGSSFSGFQRQENARSVENELRNALAIVCGKNFRLEVAGRTDAGVHARGQVVSLSLVTRLLPRQLMLALAAYLPQDLAVCRIDKMPLGFDARTQSVGKRYVYRIHQGAVPDPFYRTTCYFVRQPLDISAMQDAAQLFVGEHDFASFRSSLCNSMHARRYVWQVKVTSAGSIIEIDIRGNAFCMNMVRIIAGTLIEVGKKKRNQESIVDALANPDRKRAGPTAPAHGLTLEQVYYPDDLSMANIPAGARFPRYPVTDKSWPFIV